MVKTLQKPVLDFSLEETEAMNLRAHVSIAKDIERVRIPLHKEASWLVDNFAECVPGDAVLDVGCGWGAYAKHFRRHGMRYTGIDVSPDIIEIAQKENPDLTFEVMSYRKLAFPSESFAGLWCCCSLEFEPKRNITNVLRELSRVLVRGGLLYIVSPAYGSDEFVSETDDGDPMYISCYDIEELSSKIRSAEFRIDHAEFLFDDGSNVFRAHK